VCAQSEHVDFEVLAGCPGEGEARDLDGQS
jgi:hypothetical protein